MSDKSLLERYPYLEAVFMDREAIAGRVAAMAATIRQDWADCERLCLVAILKGACFFACDLARALQEAGVNDVRVDFIRASTYGSGMKGPDDTERAVRVENFTGKVAGERVLLVDDVLDQGFTLSELKRYFLSEAGAASVRTAVFLEKELAGPSAALRSLRASLRVDYVGVRAPDRWLVGYGLDLGERFRELPFIAIAREECFR
ncbi:MAG: phosphoribosyltransferase [Lentisphaeria bacterium]|jgi:hypoxanthine phosphoribosyltransferase